LQSQISTVAPLPPLLNRAAQLPADNFFQLAPIGEFPISVEISGKPVTLLQILDDQAVTAMCNRFEQDSGAPNFPGLLLDYDHASLDPDKSSEAAGWIHELQNRGADGLWGKILFTGPGNAAVTDRRFLFASPVFLPTDCQLLGNSRIRPLKLKNVALTNAPNLAGLKPFANSDHETFFANAAHQQTLPASAASAAPRSEVQTPTQGNAPMPMKSELLKMLGLDPAADDAAILAAIKALQNRAIVAEQAQLETLVEADLVKFDGVIANREETKKQLLANRAGTLAVLASVKAPAAIANPPLTNRATAKTPKENSGKQPTLANKQAAAVEAYRNSAKCSFQEAWDHVRFANPELFPSEEKSE
ncbi:MAG: hypothetical protein HY343_08655, partial [Lentisphaerae bacterium]|nr:hypothetical protein [Lentisphaerota bacterium]